MIITFCGNSSFCADINTEKLLIKIIEQYAENNAVLECYCGGYGGFDNFAANCVNKTKQKFNNIKNCLVVAYITQKTYNKDDGKKIYDEIIYPPLEFVPYKFAILRRNTWMVDKADIVISYVKQQWAEHGKH